MLSRAHLARLYRKKGRIRDAEAVEAHLLKLLAELTPTFHCCANSVPDRTDRPRLQATVASTTSSSVSLASGRSSNPPLITIEPNPDRSSRRRMSAAYR